jgi:hypothetical protein
MRAKYINTFRESNVNFLNIKLDLYSSQFVSNGWEVYIKVDFRSHDNEHFKQEWRIKK